MKKATNILFCKGMNFLLFSFLLPVVYGCGGGGGGGSASVGSLFGTSSTGVTLASTDTGLTTVYHNPEPATMLLLGSGIVAMGFVKNLRKK